MLGSLWSMPRSGEAVDDASSTGRICTGGQASDHGASHSIDRALRDFRLGLAAAGICSFQA